MAEWYSRADRERMAQGLDPLPRSTLTIEDYKDILELAMQEARDGCQAQGLIGDVAVKDMGNVHAGLTSSNRGLDGKLTGKYDVSVDWSEKFRNNLADPGTGTARFAQRLTAVYHEFRHVEQHGMVHGAMPIKTKEDMEVATQMVVNSMYPSLYSRGYENTISEVDADVYGIQGALAFVDRHPELKERYGFDFRKEIMRTDEYDVLPDETQLQSRPEDLLSGMMCYRRHVYSDPWVEVGEGAAGQRGEARLHGGRVPVLLAREEGHLRGGPGGDGQRRPERPAPGERHGGHQRPGVPWKSGVQHPGIGIQPGAAGSL